MGVNGRLHHIGTGRHTPEPRRSCSSTTYTSASSRHDQSESEGARRADLSRDHRAVAVGFEPTVAVNHTRFRAVSPTCRCCPDRPELLVYDAAYRDIGVPRQGSVATTLATSSTAGSCCVSTLNVRRAGHAFVDGREGHDKYRRSLDCGYGRSPPLIFELPIRPQLAAAFDP